MRPRPPLLPPLLLLAAGLALAVTPGALRGQCQISTTPVDFGSYDVLDPSPTASTGSVTYFCAQPDQPVTVTLSTGLAGGFQPRRMSRGSEHLDYNLYLDPAATAIWGDGTAGTTVFSGTTGPAGPPADRTFVIPVYGRIPPQQDVAFGDYADLITVTVIF